MSHQYHPPGGGLWYDWRMKTCTKCKQTRTYNSFPRTPGKGDGFGAQCKLCVRQRRLSNAREFDCASCGAPCKSTKPKATRCVACAALVASEASRLKTLPAREARLKEAELVRQRVCPECDRGFTQRRTDQTYCTDVCARRASGRRKHQKRLARNREFIRELKSNNPCTDCGSYFHFCAMQYDHVLPGKQMDISRLVTKGVSIERIEQEIALCELVCANCHSIRTYRRLTNP